MNSKKVPGNKLGENKSPLGYDIYGSLGRDRSLVLLLYTKFTPIDLRGDILKFKPCLLCSFYPVKSLTSTGTTSRRFRLRRRTSETSSLTQVTVTLSPTMKRTSRRTKGTKDR